MISRRLLRIKVVQALYAHITSESELASGSQKSLNHSIAKCYELYHLMLLLPCEVAKYSETQNKISVVKSNELEKDVPLENRLASNPVIAQLDNSKAINEYLDKRFLSWNNNKELVKNVYNSTITKEYYKEYMGLEKCAYNDHKNFVINFYKEEIENNEFLHEELEDMSIFWTIDVEYAASHALKTVSGIAASCVTAPSYEEIKLLPLYKDMEDQFFARDLFVKTINNLTPYLEIIDTLTLNWDVERMAIMDRIILLCAITEIKQFNDIPNNVTMDEYIEISKYYSTVKSSNIINGVLDKLIAGLKESKEVVKFVSE